MKAESDGVELRIISKEKPVPEAKCVEASLEDVFLYYFGEKAGDKMLNFELKKVFSKSRNKIVILLMVVITIITSILTINRVEYVDENGNHSVGFTAAKNLRDARNEWAGYLTDDVLKKVIAENRRINNSDEAQSDDIAKQDQAFSEKQGIWVFLMLSIPHGAITETTIILPLTACPRTM